MRYPEISYLNHFDGARDVASPAKRLDAIRGRAQELRDQLLAGPKASILRDVRFNSRSVSNEVRLFECLLGADTFSSHREQDVRHSSEFRRRSENSSGVAI